MPRSSRHKSYKQSKHSSKDSKEHSECEGDSKLKDRYSKEESTVRVSSSGEKRKVISSSRDAKDRSGYCNGDVSDDYAASKRRKDKADVDAIDRWSGGDDEHVDVVIVDNDVKEESHLIDSKIKSSRRHGSVGDKIGDVGIAVEKVDSKKKVEKDSCRKEAKDVKEKERSDKDKKVQERKRHMEVVTDKQVVDDDAAGRKHGSESVEYGEEQVQRGTDNTDWPLQKELRNPELERELEKRMRRRDGSIDKDKYDDDSRDVDDRRLSSRSHHATEGKYKDEKHKDASYKDKYREVDRENRHKDSEKPIEDVDKENRHDSERPRADVNKENKHKDGERPRKDVDFEKPREDVNKENRHQDSERPREDVNKENRRKDGGRPREDADRNNRRKDGRSREDVDRDDKRKDGRSREDVDRDDRPKDGGHPREDIDRDIRHKDGRVRKGGDRENRHKDDRSREDVERDDRKKIGGNPREDIDQENRHRDGRLREDGDRENRHRDDRSKEDIDRDNRHKVGRLREDGDRENRRKDDRPREDGDRENRRKDDRPREDGGRENRRKDDRPREDCERYNKHRDEKPKEDVGRDKRSGDDKYSDERSLRDPTSDKSDTKHSRDEVYAGEIRNKKSRTQNSNFDDSSTFDDRNTRHRDDARRRSDDKEDQVKYQNSKEQLSDIEKKSGRSVKVESVPDRERFSSRHTDVESALPRNRRRNSPSSASYVSRDQYRPPMQAESTHRDSGPEGRVQHDVSGVAERGSLPRSLEKFNPKEDSHMVEFSGERSLRSDTRTSPLQGVGNLLSSSPTDRKYLNRGGVRRCLETEESGHKNGGFKDTKGSRELPSGPHPSDDDMQLDEDNFSVSSNFSKAAQGYNHSKSFPPHTYNRSGVDVPSVFGSSEEDNRGKFNNRYKRIGDPNMRRVQGNTWKGVSNWPSSPVPNGFMHFQHGPPPVSYHAMMQQFPPPQMFGGRPSMELNHAGFPYHIPDHDRFSGHGQFGWRNPIEESCRPPIHGWDDASMYGRMEWDQNGHMANGQHWERSVDMWKGQNGGMNLDLPSASHKEDYSVHGLEIEGHAGQPGQQIQIEQNGPPDIEVESMEITRPSEAVVKDTLGASVTEERANVSETPKADDGRRWLVYLSKLDISMDLTGPDLYDQSMSLMERGDSFVNEENDYEREYVEVIEARLKISLNIPSASISAAVNDSIFQRAMSLYKKQKEERRNVVPTVSSSEKILNSNAEKQAAIIPFPETDGAVVTFTASPAAEAMDGKAEMLILEKTVDLALTDDEKNSKDPVVDAAGEENAEEIILPNSQEKEEKLLDMECGSFFLPEVTSEVCEAVMKSIESGSVNLSRIQ